MQAKFGIQTDSYYIIKYAVVCVCVCVRARTNSDRADDAVASGDLNRNEIEFLSSIPFNASEYIFRDVLVHQYNIGYVKKSEYLIFSHWTQTEIFQVSLHL